jgi:glycosyltransferase involved in cell wall biosynthesis
MFVATEEKRPVMKLLVDGQALQGGGKYRGIGRYSRELLEGMIRVRPDWQCQLIQVEHLDPIEPIQGMEVIWYRAPLPIQSFDGPTTPILRLHFSDWIRHQEPDLLLVMTALDEFSVPIHFIGSHCPVVTIFYDLIPLIFAKEYLYDLEILWRAFSRQYRQMLESDACVCISKGSENDLIELLGFQGKTANIQGAVPSSFKQLPREKAVEISNRIVERAARNHSQSPANYAGFLLYVGGGDFRKNLLSMLKAFALLPVEIRDQYPVMLAGDLNEAAMKLLTHGLNIEHQVLLSGYINDEELIALYQTTRLLVFPSLYEGLGLPLLEALACGTDVITSRISSLPEFAGPGTILVNNPLNIEEISLAIYSALRREAATDISLKQNFVQQFSWEHTAAVACETIEKMLLQFPTRVNTIRRIAWTRRLDETTKVDALKWFCSMVNSSDHEVVFIYPPEMLMLPEAISSRLIGIDFSEINTFQEANPIEAFVYEIESAKDVEVFIPWSILHPGILLVHVEQFTAEMLESIQQAIRISKLVILTRNCPGISGPNVIQLSEPGAEWSNMLERVCRENQNAEKQWVEAVINAASLIPDADLSFISEWADWRAERLLESNAAKQESTGRKQYQPIDTFRLPIAVGS